MAYFIQFETVLDILGLMFFKKFPQQKWGFDFKVPVLFVFILSHWEVIGKVILHGN